MIFIFSHKQNKFNAHNLSSYEYKLVFHSKIKVDSRPMKDHLEPNLDLESKIQFCSIES